MSRARPGPLAHVYNKLFPFPPALLQGGTGQIIYSKLKFKRPQKIPPCGIKLNAAPKIPPAGSEGVFRGFEGLRGGGATPPNP
jgi:hypothetical protein